MFLAILSCAASSVQRTVVESTSSTISASTLCDFEQRKQECIGQLVQITGNTPQMLHSHPIISSPSGIDSVQKYLQFGEQQLIILSDRDWTCIGEIKVTGLLQEINMGGPTGTRGSYKNYYISESKIQCSS